MANVNNQKNTLRVREADQKVGIESAKKLSNDALLREIECLRNDTVMTGGRPGTYDVNSDWAMILLSEKQNRGLAVTGEEAYFIFTPQYLKDEPDIGFFQAHDEWERKWKVGTYSSDVPKRRRGLWDRLING